MLARQRKGFQCDREALSTGGRKRKSTHFGYWNGRSRDRYELLNEVFQSVFQQQNGTFPDGALHFESLRNTGKAIERPAVQSRTVFHGQQKVKVDPYQIVKWTVKRSSKTLQQGVPRRFSGAKRFFPNGTLHFQPLRNAGKKMERLPLQLRSVLHWRREVEVDLIRILKWTGMRSR